MSILSENDSSSDSSSNEFLVPADKLDFNSSFFQEKSEPKQQQRKKTPAKSKVVKKQVTSKPAKVTLLESSDDDEFDDDNQVSSAELLSQVLKNLENAKSKCLSDVVSSSATKTVEQNNKGDLSQEINDLLMMGESQPSTSKVNMEVDVKQKDTKVNVKADDYVIPEKGVQIHLPGESLIYDKKKKKQQDLQKMLQNKINSRIRKTQLFTHKVGLLCWLAHGFHLNQLANDADLLGLTLSLVSPQNYPKDRPDLKYLEKFTQWFGSLFKICEEHKAVVFSKDTLVQRIADRKIYNYIEMVLIYVATVRGLGINCRLVVSLQPPRLKPGQDQLFKISTANDEKKNVKKEEEDDDDDEEMEDVVDEAEVKSSVKKVEKENGHVKPVKKESAKKQPGKSAKSIASRKRLKTKKESVSPSKIIPENSSEAEKTAREEAKKKAAAILKGKTNCRVVLERGNSELAKNQKSLNLKNLNEKNTRSNKTRGKDVDNDDEEDKEKKLNQNSTRSKKRIPNKSKKSNNDESDDDDDDQNEVVKNNMSIARKLSLRVKEKPIKATSSSKSKNCRTSGRSKTSQSSKNKKNPFNDETSDFEEEVDSSSEFSEKDVTTDFSSDSEFEEKKPRKRSLVKKSSSSVNKSLQRSSVSKKKTNETLDRSIISKFAYKAKNPRKLISLDDENEQTNKKGFNVWVEVYLESEESWISVGVLDQKIHCVSQLYKKANHPVLYVIAWDTAGTLKDVTRRYCPHWLTDTRKKRVEEKWWNDTLSNWKEKKTPMSITEDEQLLQRELEQPLPKTLSECKGHPLYVLQRHLLKFEALYPPDVVPLGHLKTGEAIYSRHCVHTLYSRETWVRKARVVKPSQEAYKIVKSMPKYDKLSGQKIKDQPLELFGKWQTNPYEPPVAKDGKIPRNEYGNVDLFKMCMLPKGCVYIDLPALNRIARKLNIDCAPACIGFNFGCRGALPAFQGFVVCKEYEDTLREAWEEEQVIAQKRAQEKIEKRIYGNWKKLIKGLLIREKLAAKYKFGDEDKNAEDVDDDDDDDGEEEEKTSSKGKKKPTVKKAPVESTKTKGKKRAASKQETTNPKKKLKK